MEENLEEITKIRKKILARNPNAFEKKIQLENKNASLLDMEKSISTPTPNVKHIKG